MIAENRPVDEKDSTARQITFGCIHETWRQKAQETVYTIPRNYLLDTLKLVVPGLSVLYVENEEEAAIKEEKTQEASDLQMPLFTLS